MTLSNVPFNRRQVLTLAGAAAVGTLVSQPSVASAQQATLPPLPYAFDALEPYIDAQTMQIHHDKHHQAYIDKLNAALAGNSELMAKRFLSWLRSWIKCPRTFEPRFAITVVVTSITPYSGR